MHELIYLQLVLYIFIALAEGEEKHTEDQNASGFVLVTLITLIAGFSASAILILMSSAIVSNISIFYPSIK